MLNFVRDLVGSRMTKVVIPSENQEQRALVKWLSMHPVLKDYYLKNNNEGRRTLAQGWNLKLMGLRAGVSDLFIAYPTNRYHGLWLEVKRNVIYSASQKKTDTWIAQKEWIDRMNSAGYFAAFCFGWEDGKSIVEGYLCGELLE